MPPTWYNTPDRIRALDTAAQGWLGTPFMANSAAPGPGGGVSCHHLVAELHFATGCLARFPVPRGDPSALQHATPDHLLSLLDPVLLPRGFVSVPDFLSSPLLPGSLAVLRYGRTLHHLVTILSGGSCIHVTRLGGAIIEPLASLFADPRVSLAALRRPSPFQSSRVPD